MVTTNVRASALADGSEAFMHYMIDVQSLKVGDHELLQFKDKSIAIQAILDSGTSCLVVPDDTFGGGLLASPFKTFQKHFGDLDEPTIYITIEGQTFSLPYDDYMVDDKPCVMKMKSTPRTFLLGDVFFRRMVVVHNLNDPLRPRITLGQRDPDYKLTAVAKKVGGRSHVALGKKLVQRPMPETEHAVYEGARVRVGQQPTSQPRPETSAVGVAADMMARQRQFQQFQQQQQQALIPGQQPEHTQFAAYRAPQEPASPAEQESAGMSVGYAGMGVGMQGGGQPMVQPMGSLQYREMAAPRYAQSAPAPTAAAPAARYQVSSSTGEVYALGGTRGGGAMAPQQQMPMVGQARGSQAVGSTQGVGAGQEEAQQGGVGGGGGAQGWGEEGDEPPPAHNPSAGARRRLLSSTFEVERVPMTTSNSYIYYASLEVLPSDGLNRNPQS
jgi:hypothetical protein